MLRLQHIGKKKNPSYRLVVSEKTKDPQAGTLENLGIYNPAANPKIIDLKKDRIEHWLSVGAQASETVHNLLVNEGIVKGEKRKSVYLSKKRQEKLNEKKNVAEEAKDVEAKATESAVAKVKADEEAKEVEESKATEAKVAEETVKEEAPVAEAPPAEEPKE